MLGLQELFLGQKERTCQSWKRCLELSEQHLDGILRFGKTFLSERDFVDDILPDRPEVLIGAAMYLYPSETDTLSRRRPFLEKALARLKAETSRRGGESYFLQAQCCRYLGRADEALQGYKKALDLEPRRAAWRLEYARLLYSQGKSTEAREEVDQVLHQEPGNTQARTLLNTIGRNPFKKPAKSAGGIPALIDVSR